MKKLLIIFLGFSALASCNKQSETQYVDAKQYFDLPNYINVELDKIESESIKKYTSDGIESEETTIEKQSMLESIEFLSRININKPAWQGKFVVDTIETKEGRDIIYKTDDLKINIKELKVQDLDLDGNIDRCIIEKRTDSPLSKWVQTISFSPLDKRIEILNELDKTLGKEKESYIKLAYEW
jgi:hypothetical protein